jgi:hypothetical protein
MISDRSMIVKLQVVYKSPSSTEETSTIASSLRNLPLLAVSTKTLSRFHPGKLWFNYGEKETTVDSSSVIYLARSFARKQHLDLLGRDVGAISTVISNIFRRCPFEDPSDRFPSKQTKPTYLDPTTHQYTMPTIQSPTASTSTGAKRKRVDPPPVPIMAQTNIYAPAA